MTFIWFALRGLALLIVAVFVIGMLMPERYTGRSQVVYPKTAQDVWAALLDYESHPMTGKMKKSVQAQPAENGLPVWIEDMGQGDPVTVRTVAAEPPGHMVREMTAKTVPMTSRWEYKLEPTGQPGACPPKPWRRGVGNLIGSHPALRNLWNLQHLATQLRRRLGALITLLRPPQTAGRLTPTPFSVAAPRAMTVRLYFIPYSRNRHRTAGTTLGIKSRQEGAA